jgi:hypothetical protein
VRSIHGAGADTRALSPTGSASYTPWGSRYAAVYCFNVRQMLASVMFQQLRVRRSEFGSPFEQFEWRVMPQAIGLNEPVGSKKSTGSKSERPLASTVARCPTPFGWVDYRRAHRGCEDCINWAWLMRKTDESFRVELLRQHFPIDAPS